MPVPSNVENITVGDLNNQDVEATPTSIHDKWGANWAYHMSEYDSGLADVLLKEETLRQYLPATLLQEWADPTNTITTDMMASLRTLMWQKTRLYTSASNDEDASSTIATNARGADAGMAMVNAMQKFSIKVDEINSTAKPAQLQATKNRMLGTTLLMYSHIALDAEGEDMLVLPEPSETLTNIFENATGTREMSKLFSPGRKTTERAMGASDHFILKGTNMTKINLHYWASWLLTTTIQVPSLPLARPT